MLLTEQKPNLLAICPAALRLPTDPMTATVALLQLLARDRADALYADATYQLLRAWIDGAGSAQAAVEAIEDDPALIEDVGVLPLNTRARIAHAVAEARRLCDAWEAAGYAPAALATPSYPSHLEDVLDAPALLFGSGAGIASLEPGIAVVGTRQASSTGTAIAFAVAKSLAVAGIPVYSGMARGIDTAAHRGALAGGGFTAAVMGTPITKRYPAENRDLADEIVEAGGALLSEFTPETRTLPWHFLRRNRTMSGLAIATLVVEAGMTSGAKAQATAALKHGRAVYLPDSLIASQSWAAAMVRDGIDGVRARRFTHVNEIIAQFVHSTASVGAAF
jgi:DNA processing protein